MSWVQLQTVLWLRWRLTRNQWSRGGAVHVVLAVVVIVVIFTVGVGGLVVGALAGSSALARATPANLTLAWDVIVGVFLAFWAIGIITEIQRSETIDLGRLLHLPISLKTVFFVNYAASHLTPALVLFLPGMLGLCVGLSWGRGWQMLWLAPSVLAFVFMISAWTYCLRGWLVALMVNPRRRRAIIVGLTAGVMILGQLPNLVVNVFAKPHPEHPGGVAGAAPGPFASNPALQSRLVRASIIAHNVVPFLWLPNGARGLAQGNPWPALLGIGGACLLGGLGLRRAYQGTIGFYQGRSNSGSGKSRPLVKSASGAHSSLIERDIPGVPTDAAVFALASFRSLLRAPELKMALASNVIMMVVFGSLFLGRRAVAPSSSMMPFVATGCVAIVFFSLFQLMINQFGADRDGFRVLLLLPTRRSRLLLGRNLAYSPLAMGAGTAILVCARFLLALPAWILAAGFLQLASAFLLVCILGNVLSITCPYRIAPGSLKPTKAPLTTMLLILAAHLLFPLAMLPVFVPAALTWLADFAGWRSPPLVDLVLSFGLLLVMAMAYWVSLRPLSDLLQRRERKILRIVTQEVE